MLAVMTEQARLGQDPGGYCPWQVSNWALEGCPVQTARWPLRGSVPGSLYQAEKRSGYPTSVAADRAVSWTPRCRVRGLPGSCAPGGALVAAHREGPPQSESRERRARAPAWRRAAGPGLQPPRTDD